MKRFVSTTLCMLLVFMLAACSKTPDSGKPTASGENVSQTPSQAQEIYYLSSKPELSVIYDRLAADYKKETGVTLKVLTSASDAYEQTLNAELKKEEAPAIFQINGSAGYKGRKDHCADLKDTKLYSQLADKSLAIKNNNGVYGIPYGVEAYGVIYNDDITDRYFSLDNRQKKINSMDEITSFEKLKTVVEDMQKHRDTLEIDGVFASAAFSGDEERRWTTHLANIPLYYELSENKDYDDAALAGLGAEEVKLKYGDNFGDILSLYIENSGTEKSDLDSKSMKDSLVEFATGKVAMLQSGTWAYDELTGIIGNKVEDDDIKMLPIYTGMDTEENQGLCVGAENYIAVNSKASKEKQEAAIKFLEWLISSKTGKKYLTEDFKLISPFNTLGDDEMPESPLAKETVRWLKKDNIKSVPWIFGSFPGDGFEDGLSSSLLEFAQGKKDWSQVKDRLVSLWKAGRENRG